MLCQLVQAARVCRCCSDYYSMLSTHARQVTVHGTVSQCKTNTLAVMPAAMHTTQRALSGGHTPRSATNMHIYSQPSSPGCEQQAPGRQCNHGHDATGVQPELLQPFRRVSP